MQCYIIYNLFTNDWTHYIQHHSYTSDATSIGKVDKAMHRYYGSLNRSYYGLFSEFAQQNDFNQDTLEEEVDGLISPNCHEFV